MPQFTVVESKRVMRYNSKSAATLVRLLKSRGITIQALHEDKDKS